MAKFNVNGVIEVPDDIVEHWAGVTGVPVEDWQPYVVFYSTSSIPNGHPLQGKQPFAGTVKSLKVNGKEARR